MGGTLRTSLPILRKKLDVPRAKEVVKLRKNRKMSQKFYHDRKTKSLKALKPRRSVTVYNPRTKSWDKKATVKFQVSPRSYVVKTGNDASLRRNRIHLRSTNSYVDTPMLDECNANDIADDTINCDPDAKSTDLDRPELERPRIEGSENESPERASIVRTRSGREIKKPSRLIETMN